MIKLIALLFTFSLNVFAQPYPIAGKIFTVHYNPTDKNIFNARSRLTLVYAFDYWSSKGNPKIGIESLFNNVLDPDANRKKEILMSEKNGIFSATINIPDSAQLLSYYLTDGNNFDYNDKKTYTSYIYNDIGKPVKGARFRNVDFLIMAGADKKRCIEEIENEIQDYPDFHLARYVLWKNKFENEKDFNNIIELKNEFIKEYAKLKKEYPNDYGLLNSEAKIYNAFQIALYQFINPYLEEASKNITNIAIKIPDGQRDESVERFYQSYLQQQKSEKFAKEIIGKPAPDFDFISIDGKKNKLSDFKNKYVLLDFWGTWCGPCVSEIPNLIKNYNKFKDKGFEIISISSDLIMNTKNEKDFKDFIQKKNMLWIQVLDDKNKTIHNLYNISHWPTLYLIDKNGFVIKDESDLRDDRLAKSLNEILGINNEK